MEKKIVNRIFTIADYDREALYLRKMHAEGWKLKEVSYSNLVVAVKYTFEKVQLIGHLLRLALFKSILNRNY